MQPRCEKCGRFGGVRVHIVWPGGDFEEYATLCASCQHDTEGTTHRVRTADGTHIPDYGRPMAWEDT